MSATNPLDRRCRLITTHEGKFLNLDDFVAALNDDAFVKKSMEMLAVGVKREVDHVEVMRIAMAHALYVLSGELDHCLKEVGK